MGSDGTPEQKEALKKSRNGESFTPAIRAIAFGAMVVAISMVIYAIKLANEDKFKVLAGKGIPKKSPESYATKLEFTVKYWIIPLIWLKINLWLVISKRVGSRAVNPMDGFEHVVSAVKNILANTMEQLVASILMQLILIAYLSNVEVTKFIPMINILFFVGRATFWLGYPRFRTFGFMTTSIPTTIGVSVCAYRFLTNHFGIVI